jgi:glycosyltransferase involved in cell wall biosynthesis
MLSICIPIYNIVPTNLVENLQFQIKSAGITAEICLLDDASPMIDELSLQKLSNSDFTKLIRHNENKGRSFSRNHLAKMAQYEYLLFIDADSGIDNSSFLDNYLRFCHSGIVCCGGTKYQNSKPEKSKILRWKYGNKRETTKAATRAKNPWGSFSSHHFLIDKQTFLNIGFDESLIEYGHEDTLFGLALKEKSIPITHIDNPLLHLGLENNYEFLNKTELAINNLISLYEKNGDREWFSDNIRLVNFYRKQKRMQLIWLWRFLFNSFKPVFKFFLIKTSCPIFVFDVYKIGFFISRIQQINSKHASAEK